MGVVQMQGCDLCSLHTFLVARRDVKLPCQLHCPDLKSNIVAIHFKCHPQGVFLRNGKPPFNCDNTNKRLLLAATSRCSIFYTIKNNKRLFFLNMDVCFTLFFWQQLS